MCHRASRARSSSVAPRSSRSLRLPSLEPRAAWRAPSLYAASPASGRRGCCASSSGAPRIAAGARCAATARPSAPASWPTRRSPRRCDGSSASSSPRRSRRSSLRRARSWRGSFPSGAPPRRRAIRPRAATRSPRHGCSAFCADCSTVWRPTRPSFSQSRTCTGPIDRRSSCSRRCCAACATNAYCSSAPTAATSCIAATRCARSWPRRSAAKECSGSSWSPSRLPSSRPRSPGFSVTPPIPAWSRGYTRAARATRSSPRSCWPPLAARPARCLPPSASSLACAWRPCRTTRVRCCVWPPPPALRPAIGCSPPSPTCPSLHSSMRCTPR
jgi:hypothetical protein